MGKRVVVLLVSVGLLSGLGMPLRHPCCSLTSLESAASSPDCCPMPDCCRGEKKGAAPIVLSSRSAGVTPPSLLIGPTPVLSWPSTSLAASRFVTDVASLHGPPEATRDLLILLSTLRV